jgi:hypothetical protein
MAHLSTGRKKLPQFKKKHYKLLQNKDWVSFSLLGRTTNLMQLSVTSNTQDALAALVLRCCGNMVFEKTLPATRSMIGTKKHLKRRLKRRSTCSLRTGL